MDGILSAEEVRGIDKHGKLFAAQLQLELDLFLLKTLVLIPVVITPKTCRSFSDLSLGTLANMK